jgi:hypothetical protein
MGMVGVVQVGRPVNKGQAVAAAAKLPGMGKKRMVALVSRAQ